MPSKKVSATATEEASEGGIIGFMAPVKQFATDSYRLVKKCTKPDAKGLVFYSPLGTLRNTLSCGSSETLFVMLQTLKFIGCIYVAQNLRRSP